MYIKDSNLLENGTIVQFTRNFEGRNYYPDVIKGSYGIIVKLDAIELYFTNDREIIEKYTEPRYSVYCLTTKRLVSHITEKDWFEVIRKP